MARWSGLAPAVDAHLERWSKVHREQRAIRKDQVGIVRILMTNNPVLANWAVFARSWGLPQADGSVAVPVLKSDVAAALSDGEIIPGDRKIGHEQIDGLLDGATINGREQFHWTDASTGNAAPLMEREDRILSEAETVYMAEEIVDRISYAAAELEPEPLFPTDLLTPCGIVILEKPLLVPDYHPGTGDLTDYLHVGIRAIAWGPDTVHSAQSGGWPPGEGEALKPYPGITMISYTTSEDWKDSYGRDVVAALNKGLIDRQTAGIPEWEDVRLDDLRPFLNFNMSTGLGPHVLSPCDVMPWAFGKPWVGRDRPVYTPGTVDSAVAYVRRWFLTFMRFTWQRLITHEHPEPSKKLAKRLELSRRPRKEYSVLRLRRYEGEKSPETGTGIPLTYRIKTRGHWRRVYVPTLGSARNPDGSFNDDSHRLTWIEPYWRGPEGAEIGPLHKGTVVVR